MKIIEKDILTVSDGLIVHQTNTAGVMGSGVALAIKEKYPIVYEEYKELSNKFKNKRNELLGKIQIVKITPQLYCCNFFGQGDFGYDGKRYTSYGAWEKGLPELKGFIATKALVLKQIYFVYNIGCDRGGGDFRIISAMIEEYFPDAIFCKLPEKPRCGKS